MKRFALTWLCLTLTTAIALAADYHLWQTQIWDTEAGTARPSVWVLIQPDGQQPVVFQKLDSQQMETWLRLQVRGSVLHFHASPVGTNVFQLPVGAFKIFCETNHIAFVNESLGD